MELFVVNLGQIVNTPYGTTRTTSDLFQTILSGSYAIAGIILLFILIGGGLAVIFGAGNNDPKGAAAGKQAITYAIIGFLVIFVSYWIIRFIEVLVGVDFFTFPIFSGGGGGGR
ncbi:hypothetical protein KBA63_03625 [Candidatus Woesebacteria bacterium]|jgi:hypothetical protein|nr:hypothetical protein [Candidatus Woesebacteria bacterium]